MVLKVSAWLCPSVVPRILPGVLEIWYQNGYQEQAGKQCFRGWDGIRILTPPEIVPKLAPQVAILETGGNHMVVTPSQQYWWRHPYSWRASGYTGCASHLTSHKPKWHPRPPGNRYPKGLLNHKHERRYVLTYTDSWFEWHRWLSLPINITSAGAVDQEFVNI